MNAQLERVSHAIDTDVIEFCTSKVKKEFYGAELLEAVRKNHPKTAPDSPGRILRKLRDMGVIGYSVLDRAASRYYVTYVAAQAA